MLITAYTLLSKDILLFIIAGTPATKTLSGIFLVTTLPAATTTLFPIVTPGNMTLRAPTQTLSPIVTGACIGGYSSLNLL